MLFKKTQGVEWLFSKAGIDSKDEICSCQAKQYM